ncbi:hypothetical protein [Phormidium tenue]|uniref:DnaD domain-containing protein n=1 Tax=Phormidium tenue NIES-30 TaxID=549789 RepID=A0A1U7J910_9CYAN|nr:hypothetical protein [Phormidium tenue]MBD2231012.1 hypothetical protein [Phormidium tenue FACHB-1052]OKH49954.1 hypothetical protein NIES30_04385 [Phormidium tenue NIES-30]
MTHLGNTPDVEPIYQLLTSYSFDAEDYPTKAVITDWLAEFGPVWVSHAITEALYQGRYKVISIDQILKLWQRRGQPIRHFNREFESIILGQSLLCPTGYGDGTESSSFRRPLPSIAPPSLDLEADASLEPDAPPFDDASHIPAPTGLASDSLATSLEVEVSTDSLDGGELDTEVAGEPAIASAPNTPNIPDFRPLPAEAASPWHQADIIQPFVPRRDGSELHERLRSVVQGGMRE